MKIVVAILVLGAMGFWVFSSSQSPIVMNPQAPKAHQQANDLVTENKDTSTQKKPEETTFGSQSPSHQDHPISQHNNQIKTHIDQLSPEIKQAVKDKLLHSKPLDISKDDKGRTVLKHNGRFTQMPVAVKQPDGSVSIKEYSHIPDSK